MRISAEMAAQKSFAAREVENVMNKYEWLLSHCQFESVVELFATHMEDVRVELAFGKWIGSDGVNRCLINLHTYMMCDEDGLPKKGTYLYNYNVNGIIEIADDLKTAKGLWPAPGGAMLKGLDGEWKSSWGTALRCADFIYNEEKDHWQLWHYVVTGVTSHPYHLAPTENTLNVHTSQARPYIFTDDRHPDGEPDNFWMYSTEARMEYKNYNRVPEPYKTWDETFSY